MSKEHIKNPTGTLRDTATVMAIVSLIFQLSITGWGMTAWELNKKQEYISVMEDGTENKNSSQLCHFGFSSSITSCLVYSLKFISNSKRWKRQFIIGRMCHWTLFISVNLGYACFVSDIFFSLVISFQCLSESCFWFKIVCCTDLEICYLRYSAFSLKTNLMSKLQLAVCTCRCIR